MSLLTLNKQGSEEGTFISGDTMGTTPTATNIWTEDDAEWIEPIQLGTESIENEDEIPSQFGDGGFEERYEIKAEQVDDEAFRAEYGENVTSFSITELASEVIKEEYALNKPTGVNELVPTLHVNQVISGNDASFLIESMADEGHVECYRCKRTFQDVTECGEHMSYCGTEVSHQSALRRQFLNLIGQNSIANNAMKPKSNRTHKLNTRNQTQTAEKPFACLHSNCGKQFNCKHSLLRHIRTHSNVKPYVCTEPKCGRQFTRSDNYFRHYRAHFGDTPFACDYPNCGKKFSDKGRLTEHIRYHMNEKQYVCSELDCGKRFSRPSYLISHERIHSGERPFTCVRCRKTFRCRKGLEAHNRSDAHQKLS